MNDPTPTPIPSLALPARPSDAVWPHLEALAARDDLPPFGALQIDFAAALSRALTAAPAARIHPELMALGFWLRPAHLRKLIDGHQSASAGRLELPRGLCFHVAPGNVDTIFVYSWMLSLLCGNRSIVRLSSRESAAAEALIATLGTVLAEPAFAAIAERLCVLRYGHDDAITRRLSALCDLRIVWGGDNAVNAVRAVPLPPRATELCFPDKFSLALLDSAAVQALDDSALQTLARQFATDAYTFGQMACSSPRLVLWHGDEAATAAARTRFWPRVEARVPQLDHGLGAPEAMTKAVQADLLALAAPAARFEPGHALVRRVWLAEPGVYAALHGGGGLFHESRIATLDGLLPLLDRRIQTVSSFGLPREQLAAWVRQARPRGIDRFVPIGQALDFAPVWDGIDLWRAFLREIDLRG